MGHIRAYGEIMSGAIKKATKIIYDNTVSKLAAITVQGAIDELSILKELLPPVFDSAVAYKLYDLVTYNDRVYMCVTDHPAGVWNPANFTLRNLQTLFEPVFNPVRVSVTTTGVGTLGPLYKIGRTFIINGDIAFNTGISITSGTYQIAKITDPRFYPVRQIHGSLRRSDSGTETAGVVINSDGSIHVIWLGTTIGAGAAYKLYLNGVG